MMHRPSAVSMRTVSPFMESSDCQEVYAHTSWVFLVCNTSFSRYAPLRMRTKAVCVARRNAHMHSQQAEMAEQEVA